MKKIKAFLTALILFGLFALCLHLAVCRVTLTPSSRLGVWTGEAKFRSASLMAQSMDAQTLLVMGSSELEHGRDTPYQLINIFADQPTKLMVVGAGYYQCLFHATALAAMERGMENRKAVLIVSPQWFRKDGVKAKAYASRFSEENYVEMLQNPDITRKVKQYISDRTRELLKADKPTQKRMMRYDREYLTGTATWLEKLENDGYLSFLGEKNRTMIARDMAAAHLAAFRGTSGDETEPMTGALAQKTGEPDFDALRSQAQTDAAKASGNEFYVTDKFYQSRIVPRLEKAKDKGIKTGYSVSPEYDDLDCFLQVCRDTGIEPLLVVIPVNGYWYDYIGFGKESRAEYYRKVKALAAEYGAQVADFSDREYEQYFMEDTVHIGWKGWVDVSEAIYSFAKD